MNGTLYGVGVGPGDPKLMTFLAAETIEKCPVIAVPASQKDHALSYRIAKGMVKGLKEKECLALSIPMTKDRTTLEECYRAAANKLIHCLEEGKDAAYLTLGDPTIYSTYIYIHRLVKEQGYDAKIISGVPSFCAMAATVGDSLADRSQQLHVIPLAYDMEEVLDHKGTKVLMKAGSKLPLIKQHLEKYHLEAVMVENCGLKDERVYTAANQMPDKAGYYTTVLVKEADHD